MVTYIIVFAILAVAYLGFMKFYYPKFKQQYEQAYNESETDWNQNKDQILSEYFSNPNKFGLISQAVQGEKVLGLTSVHSAEKASWADTLKEKLVEEVTFTKSVNAALYYLVATDKGLHYTGFDGEKCFVNEVFDYSQISNPRTTQKEIVFDYKGQKVDFYVENFPHAVGYPRFNIHERDKTATSNDRTRNYFVREFLAYEMTNNEQFRLSNSTVGISNEVLNVSPEKLRDMKLRAYLLEELKKKLGI